MMSNSWKEINKLNLLSLLSDVGYHDESKIASLSIYLNNYTRTESIHNMFDELKINYEFINYYPNSYLVRYILTIFNLLKNIGKYDIIFLHFRGFEILPCVWLIGKIFGKKIIFDHFISIWDTICFERMYVHSTSLPGIVIKYCDKLMLRMPDIVLVDTKTHLEYFKSKLGLDERKGYYLYVGCNEKIFYDRKLEKLSPFTVFWYGNVQPIHGVSFILDLAKKLEYDSTIHFLLVGPIVKKLKINTINYRNIDFIEWLDIEDLAERINRSHVCLGGHFGSTEKGSRVIAGKTFQFLSCGVPTIVTANDSNKEIFKNGVDNIYFSEPGNINSAIDLILRIKKIST